MSSSAFAYQPQPALVSRAEARPGVPPSYLLLRPTGQADWTPDPEVATTFASMREAARAPLRLPSAIKAYGIPMGGLH